MSSTLPYYLLSLCVLAMAFIIFPVWRHRGTAAYSTLEQRRDKNRDVFRQREIELGQDLQQGLVTEEEHARLLAELQRAFLLDMQALDKQGTAKSAWSGGRAVLLGLALFVPIVGLGLYRAWGSGPDLALVDLRERIGAAQTGEEQQALMTELVDFLQQRQERRPGDIQNGFMLGSLQMQLERFPESIVVFQALLEELEPGPDRAVVLGQLAQAQYLNEDSTLTPTVQATIDEAMALNPNQQAVMSILAIDALVKQDFVGAMNYWRRQLADVTPGSPEAADLRERIALVEQYVPEDAAAAAVDTTHKITVVVDIAPELAAQVTDDMRLFIFVRNSAMAMPILARNLDVPEFPFTLTLDNSMAMMQGNTLESAPELVAGARLSRSGTATAQSGDLQTLSAPFVLTEQTEPVELVIDTIAP